MMNNDFLRKGIILPLVAALVAGIGTFFVMNANVSELSPFNEGAKILYFDNLKTEKRETAAAGSPLKEGMLIGEIRGKDSLDLVYEADYSGLFSAASLSEKGALIGETGTAYIQIISANKDRLGESIEITGALGGGSYKKTDEKTVNNENEVFLTAPRNDKNIVIYYREKGKGGLASEYKVIIYEEVA